MKKYVPFILSGLGLGTSAIMQSVAVAVVTLCIFLIISIFGLLIEKEKTKRAQMRYMNQTDTTKIIADMITTVSTKEYENVQKITEEKRQIKSTKMISDLNAMSILASMLAKNMHIDSENDDDGNPASNNHAEETINSVKDQSSEMEKIYAMLRGVIKSE